MNSLSTHTSDRVLLIVFILTVLAAPILLTPFGAGYPDLLQRFAVFGIFAIGFNLLFGLTGYLSFGHAAFLGIGSYAAVWAFKGVTMNILPAIAFAIFIAALVSVLIGFICLRRSGIYFSILTLAFAQMSYNLAYSVLTPLTNGETGLQVRLDDPRILDSAPTEGMLPLANLFGITMKDTWEATVFGMDLQFNAGYYICAFFLVIAFYISIRIFRSPFGMMLKAVKTNQNRLNYTGINTKPYTLAVFVISGMYAGLAGGLLAAMDPLAGAERMQWTASGEVVLMTILGGAGTLLGPVLGAMLIKYFENIFSAINKGVLMDFYSFLPGGVQEAVVSVSALFVGEGWHLTLGLIFMLIVAFLPGGLMEGFRRIGRIFSRKSKEPNSPDAPRVPAE